MSPITLHDTYFFQHIEDLYQQNTQIKGTQSYKCKPEPNQSQTSHEDKDIIRSELRIKEQALFFFLFFLSLGKDGGR